MYVSQDEGKSWGLADGIPKNRVKMVIEHPADNNYVSDLLQSSKRAFLDAFKLVVSVVQPFCWIQLTYNYT